MVQPLAERGLGPLPHNAGVPSRTRLVSMPRIHDRVARLEGRTASAVFAMPAPDVAVTGL